MAGRGRGRGRGLSINIEALGLGRGEILPPVAHPPPLFPPLPFKPVAAPPNEELNYMLALKQELRESFLRSPFHIKAPTKVKDIERYSDKYQVGASETATEFTPDWSRFPFELQERSKSRKRKKASGVVRPNLKSARRQKDKDVSVLLETLEQKDAQAENEDEADAQEEEAEDKKEQKEEGDEEDEEEYDDEDLEEETDYNLNYFDNGEEYGEDDEDDDEGPTY